MDNGKRIEPFELLAIFLLSLVLRLYAGRNTLQGGNVLIVGFDEFYHMRRILYTVAHFPNTLWFDSYLDYPHGYSITWPPLFDQLMAAISLALGQHSQHGIEMVSAIMPTVLGSIAILVVYYMVKEIFDRKVALMSAFMTALAPYYLQKSMLGETGHHWLVELWFMLAVMFLILALSRKENRYLFAAAAGVAMIGEAYTWLGSSAYFGVFLIYLVIQITHDLKNGKSSSNNVKTILVPFGLTLAFTLPFWNESWLFPTFFGAAAITAAIVVLFAISKFVLERRVSWVAFPTAIVLISGAFTVISQTLGDIWIFSKANLIIISGGDYIMGGPVEGAVSLSGLGEVVRLVDLLTDYVPLDIGLVWFSLLRNSFGSTLAARSEVDGALEHLTLHGSVALVIGHRSDRFIGGQFMEVGTQTVTLCVDVREGPALEQLVIRELDTWNKICGAEGCLFYLGEEVVRIAIEDHFAHRHQGKLILRPGFSGVQGVKDLVHLLRNIHHLDVQLELDKLASSYSLP
jgi:asparagine N-glycosylation enzyme membrane subunit Stt3